MKVRELIEALQSVDPEREVVLQKDSEGNGYSPCTGLDDNAAYEADSTWSGEVYPQTITDEMRQEGYTDDDAASERSETATPCVVLYPGVRSG